MYQCDLRVCGLADAQTLADLADSLHQQGARVEVDDGPGDLESLMEALRAGDWIHCPDMWRLSIPDSIALLLKEARLHYVWNTDPSEDNGAWRTIGDGLAGTAFTIPTHNGCAVIALADIDNPEARARAIKAESFTQEFDGIAVYDSQHELMALLAENPALAPFHAARQAAR